MELLRSKNHKQVAQPLRADQRHTCRSFNLALARLAIQLPSDWQSDPELSQLAAGCPSCTHRWTRANDEVRRFKQLLEKVGATPEAAHESINPELGDHDCDETARQVAECATLRDADALPELVDILSGVGSCVLCIDTVAAATRERHDCRVTRELLRERELQDRAPDAFDKVLEASVEKCRHCSALRLRHPTRPAFFRFPPAIQGWQRTHFTASSNREHTDSGPVSVTWRELLSDRRDGVIAAIHIDWRAEALTADGWELWLYQDPDHPPLVRIPLEYSLSGSITLVPGHFAFALESVCGYAIMPGPPPAPAAE